MHPFHVCSPHHFTHSGILAWRIHGQRSLAGYSSWGHKESDTTDHICSKTDVVFIFFKPNPVCKSSDERSSSNDAPTDLLCDLWQFSSLCGTLIIFSPENEGSVSDQELKLFFYSWLTPMADIANKDRHFTTNSMQGQYSFFPYTVCMKHPYTHFLMDCSTPGSSVPHYLPEFA